MCGKEPETEQGQYLFHLASTKKCVVITFITIQLIIFLVGVIILAVPSILNFNLILNIIIGGSIIVVSLFPKPFFAIYNNVGHMYLLFDETDREVYIIIGHMNGLRLEKKTLCSYSQFKGIAVSDETGDVLLLCKREESLRLQNSIYGEFYFNVDTEVISEEIALFWFNGHCIGNEEYYFGSTFCDFGDGIMDEQLMKIDVHFDYFEKIDFRAKTLINKRFITMRPARMASMRYSNKSWKDKKKNKKYAMSNSIDLEHCADVNSMNSEFANNPNMAPSIV